jgi:type II secretory pathway predicted ATPase ExeA
MTRYVGTAPGDVIWDLAGVTGAEFETIIARHLQNLYSYNRDAIHVEQTRRSHDRGRDIVIKTRLGVTLFGLEIPPRARRATKIYIECKLRTGDRLEPEFFFDFAQFADEGAPDHYFLVTTASLSPNVHHKAAVECAAKNVDFHLIDRVLLADYASTHSLPLGIRESAPLPDDVVIEYQSEPSLYQKEGRIDLYLIIRNYSRRPRSFTVYLTTNDAWRITEGPREISRIAEPLSALQFRLVAKRRTFEEGGDDLEFGVSIENDRRTIQVTAPEAHFAFVPRLFGDQHREAVDQLWRTVDANATFAFFSITGRAGVGKSRIVHDALESRVGKGNIDFARVFFQAVESPDELLEAFEDFEVLPPVGPSTSAQLLEHLLMRTSAPTRSRVLLLEDLHHATKPVLDVLKRFANAPLATDAPVMVIVTGRNDHTFPNEDYFSLLQVLQLAAREVVTHVELVPLAPRETLGLIRSTVRNAPKVVVKRIFDISENVPFFVIQAIEYLLEVGVAQLVNRSEVGIPHIERFSAKEYIPDTVEKLYALRLSALERLQDGPAMLDFLTTQSFFNHVVHPVIMREALDPDAAADILRELIERRFLEVGADGAITFAHENLLAVLRARARQPAHRIRAGKLVLSRPALFQRLDDLDQGEVLFLSEMYEEALARFDRIVIAVRAIVSFSSEELEVRFFRYIDAVFEAALRCGADPDLLKKIILAKAYMGIHNYPLYLGTVACDTALEQLQRIDLPTEERSVVDLEIRQLQAHGLLNMGRTTQSSGIMLELDQLVRTNAYLAARPELVFDLYDRLQELYKKLNHATVAASFGQMARRVAESCTNETLAGKLLACHSITEVGMHIYRDPRRARETAAWAYDVCVQYGAARFEPYMRLSKYVSRALADRRQATWRAILPDATALLREVAVLGFPDSLMRAQLFVATLTFLTRPDDDAAIDAAEKHVQAGINNCAKFGNGLFIWLFYNLAAVLCDTRRAKRQTVSDLFNSAIRELERQSLLFVGRRDICYPSVFVISNALMFRSSIDREDALALLERVSDYDTDGTIEHRREALRLVRGRTRLFFEPSHTFNCLFESKLRYWLPIL